MSKGVCLSGVASLILLVTTACEAQPARVSSRPSLAVPVAAAQSRELPRVREVPALDDRAIDWEANAVMRVLGRMAASFTESEYTHGFRVDEKHGIYAFGCSGMTQWVLRRATPRAAAASAFGLAGRPLARDYQRRIARTPFGATRYGWRRVQRVDEARPGDVVAWIKPKIIAYGWVGLCWRAFETDIAIGRPLE